MHLQGKEEYMITHDDDEMPIGHQESSETELIFLKDCDLCWNNDEYIDIFVPKNIDFESF